MYQDRFKAYVKDLNSMNLDLIQFTNQIADAIYYKYPASFTLPLQIALTPLYFLRLFLDQVKKSHFFNLLIFCKILDLFICCNCVNLFGCIINLFFIIVKC